jgi:predicted permease
MRAWLARVWGLFSRRRLDEELADEISAHLEFAAADQRERGLSDVEARRAASRRFGGAIQIEEAYRDRQGFPLIESAWQDARYGVRNLARQPGFAFISVAVLGSVIGLNTSLFTLTAGLLFRPWSGISEPSRVVMVYPVSQTGTAGFSLASQRYLSERATSFSGLAAMRTENVDLGVDGALGKTNAFLVSGNLFEVLGVVMARGRGFVPDDDRPGNARAVAVVGFAFWRSRFGGDPNLVGSEVRVNDVPFTVVGIAPPEFVGPEPGSANLFLPISSVALLRPNDPSAQSLLYAPDFCCSDVVGRLAPGATRNQARAELEVLAESFRRDANLQNAGDGSAWRMAVAGTEFLARPGRKNQPLAVVGVLSAGLLLVWLLACANVGNLQIARATSRSREIGVRLSLGASRGRLIRQLVTESLVVSVIASVLGVAVAFVLPPVVLRLFADIRSTPFSLAPDAAVLGYAMVLAGASAVVFGLAPALHATRSDIGNALKTHDGPASSRVRLRTLLLGLQVAISVILLVSAALLVRGAQRRSTSFDFGFSYDDVSVVSFEVPATYGTASSDALLAALTDGLRGMQGKPHAFATREPLALSREVTHIQLPGSVALRAESMWYLEVTPDYFDVLRIPMIAGRGLRASDTGSTVMINESLARLYWPNENPVGKTFLIGVPGGRAPREIIGVVRNAYTTGLDQVPPMIYGALTRPRPMQFPKLLMRGAVAADIARIVGRIDARVHATTTPLSAQVEDRLQSSRYGAVLAAILGGFALALAAVGTCGVFAYIVRQRTREIGIRIALGAPPFAVVRLVLLGQSRALLWGLVLGVAGAVPTSIVLRGFLYGLSPFDPVAYAGVSAALAVAALFASYPPVRRATRIDPVAALREE